MEPPKPLTIDFVLRLEIPLYFQWLIPLHAVVFLTAIVWDAMVDKLKPLGAGSTKLELFLEEVKKNYKIDFGDKSTCYPYTMEKCSHFGSSSLPSCSNVIGGIYQNFEI